MLTLLQQYNLILSRKSSNLHQYYDVIDQTFIKLHYNNCETLKYMSILLQKNLKKINHCFKLCFEIKLSNFLHESYEIKQIWIEYDNLLNDVYIDLDFMMGEIYEIQQNIKIQPRFETSHRLTMLKSPFKDLIISINFVVNKIFNMFESNLNKINIEKLNKQKQIFITILCVLNFK